MTPNFMANSPRRRGYFRVYHAKKQNRLALRRGQAAGTTLVTDLVKWRWGRRWHSVRPHRHAGTARPHAFLLEIHEEVIPRPAFRSANRLELPPLFQRQLFAEIEAHGCKLAL